MSNRARGDYLERQTREALRACGWIVVRAAGSHGIADLVALRRGFRPLLVSCKLDGRIGPTERGELYDVAQIADARPVVAWRTKRGYVDLGIVSPTEARPRPIDQIKVPKRADPDEDES